MNFRDRAPHLGWLAASLLSWRPDEFWQATPTELLNALRSPDAPDGAAAPSRDLIEQLMERDRDE